MSSAIRSKLQRSVFKSLAVLALLAAPGYIQSSYGSAAAPSHFFSETGHTVSDLFWKYWQTHGGLDLFGYPISDEFTEKSPTDGESYTVQYFERAVFELHPEKFDPYNVELSLLGVPAYQARYPEGASGQQAEAAGLSFPETGHSIGGRFLEYWQSHGGLPNLGYPISDEFTERSDLDGKPYTVQYFERAVLELHPENQAPYDVLLSQLGTLRFQKLYSGGAPSQQIPDISGPAPLLGDWPMYGHDPQHTSFNPAEHTIGPNNVDQLVSLWQSSVGSGPSQPSSSPSVYNGRVYVGSSVQSGPNFFAINTSDGSVAWKADLGYINRCYHVGIGATAAISGSLVVAGGGDSAFYGLNASTGNILWRNPNDQPVKAFAWSSPLIVGNRVVYGVSSYCDHADDLTTGEARMVDAATGTLRNIVPLARTGTTGSDFWQSAALSPDGNTLIINTGELHDPQPQPLAQAMIALDPATFDVQQVNQQGGLAQYLDVDWGTSPVIFHDSQGRTLVAAHSKNDYFYAYDMSKINAGPIWQKHIGTQIGLMAAYDPTARPGGLLFIPAKSGQLYAVDPATGTNVWFSRDLGAAHANIAVANGLIFWNAGQAGVLVIDEQTGKTLRTLVPENAGPAFSGVSVANGVVYFLSGSYLNAWGLP